jgi:hypothetical protein
VCVYERERGLNFPRLFSASIVHTHTHTCVCVCVCVCVHVGASISHLISHHHHNVVSWFVKADEYGLDDLRAANLGFLVRNIRQVKTQARQRLQMLADQPHLLMEVMIESLGREDAELPVCVLCCNKLACESGGLPDCGKLSSSDSGGDA